MAVATIAAAVTVGCTDETARRSTNVPGASADRGRAVIGQSGCGACHVVPGVRGPQGVVGPSLRGVGSRALLGGSVPNEPANMVRFIRNAPSLIPSTAMPAMSLTEQEARDVAAYLYTLRSDAARFDFR